MRQHNDSSALDDQMDVAPPPQELLELAQQVALDVDSTWAWSAWHAMSIGAALRLFPKPGSNFGLVVLAGFRGQPVAVWAAPVNLEEVQNIRGPDAFRANGAMRSRAIGSFEHDHLQP
jgi:hypothetical protein